MAKEMAVEKIKPSVYLTEKDCPSIKDMKVGQGYDFIIHAKMIGSSIDERESKKKILFSGRFEIVSIDHPEETKKLDESEYASAKLKRLEEKAKE